MHDNRFIWIFLVQVMRILQAWLVKWIFEKGYVDRSFVTEADTATLTRRMMHRY